MEINLHPLVDTMAALMMVLFMSVGGVSALSVEQDLGCRNSCWIPSEPAPPPLTVHLSARGAWIGRYSEDGRTVPRVAGALDLERVEALITADRDASPHAHLVVVNTDDGVPYGDMMAMLDLAKEHGYGETLLAGGPPM